MTEKIQKHETTTSLVMAPSGELDAGSDIALKVRVSCACGCKLDGQSVRIIDQYGTLNQTIEIASPQAPPSGDTWAAQPPVEKFTSNGTMPNEDPTSAVINETDEYVVKSPINPGEYTWIALFPSQEKEGVLHDASSASFSFVVKPHRTSMTVWDVPSPIVQSGKFKLKAGVLCSVGCKLTGKKIEIYDADGVNVGTASLSREPWSSSGPMYWAEIELQAPATHGVHDWHAKFSRADQEPASPEDLEHEESAYPFAFATARTPDHAVKLEVIDKKQRTPVANADVALFPEGGFPYRTRTDASGMAAVNVSGGQYEISVAMMDYKNYKTTAQVHGDIAIRAEIVYDPDLGG